MLLTLLSAIFGGLLRLAPELLKFMDARNDRQHELDMQDKQLAFLRVQGQTKVDEIVVAGRVQLAQADLDVQTAQFAAYQAAMASQAAMAVAGGKWTAIVSSLVRPAVTFMVFNMWMAYKAAVLYLAIQDSGTAEALVATWTADDWSMTSMILSFWFVGRAVEKR